MTKGEDLVNQGRSEPMTAATESRDICTDFASPCISWMRKGTMGLGI
jgi:hypothetical protein